MILPEKAYFDMREILLLAQAKGFPLWHIQPRTGPPVFARYEEGFLSATDPPDADVPLELPGFSGTIIGAAGPERAFAAYDIECDAPFARRMEMLEGFGIPRVPSVPFPTWRIAEVASSSLEASIRSYLSRMREEGIRADSIHIVGDSPIIEESGHCSRRIAFIPLSLVR